MEAKASVTALDVGFCFFLWFWTAGVQSDFKRRLLMMKLCSLIRQTVQGGPVPQVANPMGWVMCCIDTGTRLIGETNWITRLLLVLLTSQLGFVFSHTSAGWNMQVGWGFNKWSPDTAANRNCWLVGWKFMGWWVYWGWWWWTWKYDSSGSPVFTIRKWWFCISSTKAPWSTFKFTRGHNLKSERLCKRYTKYEACELCLLSLFSNVHHGHNAELQNLLLNLSQNGIFKLIFGFHSMTAVLPCFYVYTQSEGSTVDGSPVDDDDSAEFEETELVDAIEDPDNIVDGVGELWEEEEYEPEHSRSTDQTYLNFKKKLDLSPEQCFRYLLVSGLLNKFITKMKSNYWRLDLQGHCYCVQVCHCLGMILASWRMKCGQLQAHHNLNVVRMQFAMQEK